MVLSATSRPKPTCFFVCQQNVFSNNLFNKRDHLSWQQLSNKVDPHLRLAMQLYVTLNGTDLESTLVKLFLHCWVEILGIPCKIDSSLSLVKFPLTLSVISITSRLLFASAISSIGQF